MSGVSYLLVRAGARRVGVPIGCVIEVVDVGPAYPVPATEPAVRGVASVRGAVVQVLHLGAFLDGGRAPAAQSGTGVLVTLGRGKLCLEVDEVETVWQASGVPLPAGAAFPWATAVARQGETAIPLLDLSAVATALARPSEMLS